MSNSKKRGWLWCAIIGIITIIIIVAWPRKTEDYPKSEIKILPDSIVKVAEQPKTYQPVLTPKIETPTTSKTELDYSKLYEKPKERPSKYDNFKVKLNEADTNDWKELRGIGSAYARRIVNYRNSLGGYRCKEQLKEVYGMSDALYELIEPHLIVDAENIKPMNLNTATLDQLKRHPYLDYYQAKAIVNYREQVGKFNSTDELMNITLIDSTTFNKIKMYITTL